MRYLTYKNDSRPLIRLWHTLVEHRPLGGRMRARKAAYFASSKGRNADAEPDGKIV